MSFAHADLAVSIKSVMAPETGHRYFSPGISLPWNNEKKKIVCAKCGIDYSPSWNSADARIVGNEWAHKDLCRSCFNDVQIDDKSYIGAADRFVEKQVPKGSMLGPKIKGADGMRGVFEPTKRRVNFKR